MISNFKKPLHLLLVIIISAAFLSSCSSEKADLKKQLEIAEGNKDHYEIILISKKILDIDDKDLEATSAYRNSIRVYENLRYAAESLLKLDKINNLEGVKDVDLDNKDQFIKYAKTYFNEKIASDEASKVSINSNLEGESYQVFDALHNTATGCTYGDDVKLEYKGEATNTSSPSDCLQKSFYSYQAALNVNDVIDDYKQSIKHLIEAKEYFEKAQKLDPRFKGVIDLEEYLEDRADIFAGSLHYIFLMSIYPDKVNTALGTFDSFYGLTNTLFDTYSSMSFMDYSVSDAYSSAQGTFKKVYGDLILRSFEIDKDNILRVKRLYEDLDDEFDIKTLDSAIEMTESMAVILRYSTEAKGSLRDWYATIESANEDYKNSVDDFLDEIDFDKITESLTALEGDLSEILDPELVEASEAHSI
jgi:tetratricopeptide (TPR) repeat protein